jgi:PPOX class probable F420-dependent enzyme
VTTRVRLPCGMARMDDAALRAFLTAGTRTGKLAVTRKDGSPFVAPVWFVVDDDGSIVFTTGAETIKGRSLRRDGRASLCVDDERPPFAYARIDGRVTLSEDRGEMVDLATRIGARYMGAERGAEFGRRNAVPGELLVRLAPERVFSEDDITG